MQDRRIEWGIGYKLAAGAAACFLVACGSGLLYVGYLAWTQSPSPAAGGSAEHQGLPLFALATFLALGGGFLFKQTLAPPADDELP